MKNKDLEKLLPFLYFFLLASYLGLVLFGGFFVLTSVFTTEDMQSLIEHYKLGKWGITAFGLRLLEITALVIGIGAWGSLGVLIERTFKVQIFRRGYRDNYHIRPNLLKLLARRKKLSKKV
jgi:hypothetical protein